jgi:hypothetical protein
MTGADYASCSGSNKTDSSAAGLERELSNCLEAFGELRGVPINIYYKNLRSNILGQTRVKKGCSYSNGKKKVDWLPVIEISKNIKTLKGSHRVKILRYVITHELVHIARSHPFRQKGTIEHEKDFEAEVIQRLRALER